MLYSSLPAISNTSMRITIFILMAAFAKLIDGNKTDLIFGGTPANIKDVPWQVSLLRYGESHFCGGSIIGKFYVLTAGHCGKIKHFVVLYGSNNLLFGGNISRVSRTVVHPEFSFQKVDNDVAIVVLLDPIIFSVLAQPIKLRSKEAEDGEIALVSGFGLISNKKLPSRLFKAHIKIVDREFCAYLAQEWWGHTITKNMICADNVDKGSCKGDSGGALVVGRAQVGIVSHGPGKCGAYYPLSIVYVPGVYTNVARYKRFIQEVTRNKANWV